MPVEIERKFLVDAEAVGRASGVTATRAWEIRQGYVTPPGSDPEVRLRHARAVDPVAAARDGSAPADDLAEAPGTRRLTTKAATGPGGGAAVVRVEVEVDLDDARFDELWQITDGRRVEKLRIEYDVPDAAGRSTVLTVDHFHGALDGLVLGEIEFADGDAADAFEAPAFLGREVGDDPRYRNARLAVLDAPPAPADDAAGAPEDPAATGPRTAAAGPGSPGTGRDAGAVKGADFRIAPDEGLGEGLRRCAREQLDGAVAALEVRFAEEPGRAIHDARKRIKKTRALLRLARPALGAGRVRRENAVLRSAAATLSAARDADVLVQTVDLLADRYVGRLPSDTFEIVRAELAAPTAAGATPSVDEALAGLRAVASRVEDWPLAAATSDELLTGAGVAYAAGREQRPRRGERPSAHELHEWRKRVKDLWYHGLLLENAWAPVLHARAEEAHRLSEVLGDDHDLFVLRDRLCEVPIDEPAADVDGLIELIDRRRDELLDDAVELGRRLYAETPKAHDRRLARLLTAWREPVAG